MNGKEVVVRVDRRLSDYREAFSAVMRPRLFRFTLLVLALLLVFEQLHGEMIAEAILADLIIAAVAYGVGYWSTVIGAAQRQYRRHSKNTGVTYRISERGLSYRSSTGTSFTPWSDILACRETRNLFLLFYRNRRFQFLPKRGADVDADVLAQFMRSRVSQPRA